MEMEYVQSTNVEAIGYDAEAAELHVRYLGSPTVYVYQGVPSDVHERLMAGGSKGTFIHREIKGVYPFYRS